MTISRVKKQEETKDSNFRISKTKWKETHPRPVLHIYSEFSINTKMLTFQIIGWIS